MKKLRPRLTYSNVVATLALFLVLGGGAAFAAGKLKKNSVKSGNIAKGAVKNSDLGANAVTSAKIKDGSVLESDLAKGIIQNVVPDVTGTATIAGGQIANNPAEVAIPIGGTTTFTPGAGEVAAIAGEASFDLAKVAATSCSPQVRIAVSDASGPIDGLFISPFTDSTTLSTRTDRDAAGPFGLLSPGTPLTLSASLEGDASCTATSKLDNVVVRILQFK